jgi:hypothetical protein
MPIPRLWQFSPEDPARHQRPQNLRGAAADGEHAGVADHAFQRPVARIAGGAEHLQEMSTETPSASLRGALATKQSICRDKAGLLRGACHRAALRADDPLTRNDVDGWCRNPDEALAKSGAGLEKLNCRRGFGLQLHQKSCCRAGL